MQLTTFRVAHPRGRWILTVCSLLFATFLSIAQAADDVTVKLTASRIVAAKDGKEKLVAAEQAKPGDVIVYEAVYRNVSKKPVSNLQATLPIPPGLAFIEDSAKPGNAEASTDAVTFAPMPLTRTAKTEDGKTVQQPVPLNDIRALRWKGIKLQPGATFTVSARARVQTNAPSTK